MGQQQKVKHTCNGDTKRQKRKERNRSNIQNSNDKEFLKINVKHQTIDPGSLENTRPDK